MILCICSFNNNIRWFIMPIIKLQELQKRELNSWEETISSITNWGMIVINIGTETLTAIATENAAL